MSNEALVSLTDPAGQRADFNTRLQEYLRRLGDDERADELFIKQKKLERKTYLTGWPWLKSILLEYLVGYGREPWRAFVYGALIVVAGCFIFRDKKGMELQEKGDDERRRKTLVYNPFWYSLDLFAPVIDLKASSVWTPDHKRKFARNYAYVHRILGWILIPIGLAALSGLISSQ